MTDDDMTLAALLPFYANGTLGPEDRARVDAALSQSADLREELDEIRAVQALVHDGAADWAAEAPAADEARLDRLLARIEAETPVMAPAPAPAPRRMSTPERRPGFFASLFQPAWKPAFAAMAMVAAVQGVMLYQGAAPGAGGDVAGGYQTASGEDDRHAKPAFTLLVRFGATMSLGECQMLLEQEGLMIVDGPTDGLFEIAPVEPIDAAAQAALQDRLKEHPLIDAVLPVK